MQQGSTRCPTVEIYQTGIPHVLFQEAFTGRFSVVPVLVENCTISNTHAHTKYKYLAGLYVRTIADRLAL